jgi:hypothetical protein
MLGGVAKRKAVVFVISDFIADGFERSLRIASARHDVIPIQVVDRREEELPDLGIVLMEDLETGALIEVDTGSARAREAYATHVAKQRAAREQLWKRLSLDHVTIYTDRPYVRPIADLFRLRQKRVRHG